jgi:hypothetical protein
LLECFSTLYTPQTNRCFRQAQQSATKPQQCANSAGEGSFPTHRSQPLHQTVTLVGVFEPKSDMHDILTVPGLRNWCCNCTVQSLILGRAHQRTGTLHNTLLLQPRPMFLSISHKVGGKQTGSENRLHVSGPMRTYGDEVEILGHGSSQK